TATPLEVREAVQKLLEEAWSYRKPLMKPLHHSFVLGARRRSSRFAMADPQTPKLKAISALARSIFLARRLRKSWEGQRMVGLLLPPSVPGALVNFAALMMGKVPVNLNYTLSEESLSSCIQQCDIKTVLTSRAFVEKVKLKVSVETLFLEEFAARPGTLERLSALMCAWLAPVRLLERSLGC